MDTEEEAINNTAITTESKEVIKTLLEQVDDIFLAIEGIRFNVLVLEKKNSKAMNIKQLLETISDEIYICITGVDGMIDWDDVNTIFRKYIKETEQ